MEFSNYIFGNTKKELLLFKIERNLAPKLEATDIVPLVNRAFAQSFGRPDLVVKAISERGWCPANYNIMLDKRLDSDTLSGTTTNDTFQETIESLNLSTGTAATVMQKLVQHANQSEGIKR